jgi:hypothetical protein
LSGIPLHEDDATVIKERIYLDKADRNLLHDEITVADHALTPEYRAIYRTRPSADRAPTRPIHVFRPACRAS